MSVAEQRVVDALRLGDAITATVAERLGVSYSTALNHLYALYRRRIITRRPHPGHRSMWIWRFDP